MKKLRTLTHICLALCYAGMAANQPLPVTEPRTYLGGLLRLHLPTGWQATETDPQTLVLSDGAGRPPVEISWWEMPRGGDPSARAAAAAHEAMLFEQMPYRRSSCIPVKCRSGQDGMLVVGRVRDDSGRIRRTSFATFADAGRYWVAATFQPDDAPETGAPLIQELVGVVELTEPATTEVPVVVRSNGNGEVAIPVGVQPPKAADAPPLPPVEPAPGPTGPEPAPARPERVTVAPVGPTVGATAPQPSTIQPQPQPAPAAPGPQAPTPIAPPTTTPNAPLVQPAPARPPEGGPISRPAVATPGAPAIASPTVGPGDVRPPQPPAVQDGAPGEATRDGAMIGHESALGFSLEHPANWRVQLVAGHIEVAAVADEGSALPAAAVVIWPFSQVTTGQDPAELGRSLLEQTELVGPEAAVLRARVVDEAAVLAGQVGGLHAPRRVVACCYLQHDQGLLTAVLARPEEFEQRLPAMLHVLDTFQGGPWWSDTDTAERRMTIWQEPPVVSTQGQRPGWLLLPVPEGWQVTGQSRLIDDLPVISVEMQSKEPAGLRCLWRQPLAPMYRDLTPVLRNLGWQEGDRYPANVRENQLRVSARLAPQDYLTKRWLTESPARLENAVLDRLTVTQSVASLAGQQNAAGVIAMLHGDAAGGLRQRICLLATGDVAPGGEPNCWQVGILEAEAPAGAVAEAMAVLHAAVDGAMVVDTAPAIAAERLREQIGAARMALSAQIGPTRARVRHADVLAMRNTQGRGRLWLLPLTALEPWRQAGRALAQRQPLNDAMPELTADYWK